MTGPDFDVTRKFVRVLRTLPNGMVEFSFAVGSPDVEAELVMPRAAFDEFCRAHAVEFLAPALPPDATAPEADFQWRMHQATGQRFR